jgi:hypothetical protein
MTEREQGGFWPSASGNYGLLLAAADLVVRHWWPIDRWGKFVLAAELADLPQ